MMSLVLDVADDPVEADRQADEIMQRWWRGDFTRQHYSYMLGRTITALYRGDWDAAWRVVAETRPIMKRKLLLRLQVVRIEVSFLRGRCAAAMAAAIHADGPGAAGRRRFLSISRPAGPPLPRARPRWAGRFALVVRAGASV